MSSEQEQVQVRFTTQQPEYAVNDAAILLPSNIKKEGLSEIVNSLLALGNKIDLSKSRSFFFMDIDLLFYHVDVPIPFDFLIDGQLLRTSIVEYLNAARLSTVNIYISIYPFIIHKIRVT